MSIKTSTNLLNFAGLEKISKEIFNYFSIFTIIIGTTIGTMNTAFAADGDEATGEVANSATVSATDANGILETTDGDKAITIDPDGGITLGATGDADAITLHTDGDPGGTFTVTVTDSDTGGDLLTVAGDIDVLQEATDSLVLNVTNANILIQNDIKVKTTNLVDINLGSGGNVTMTVDHDVNEAQEIEALIDGNATNTVTLAVTETTSTANSTTFEAAIGATTALDAININPTNDETVSVVFQAAVSATAITLGDATDAASDDTSATFQAQTADYTVTGTINNAVAADETAIHVVDATASTAPDTITFASNIGTSIPIDAITVGAADAGGDAIFSGNVSATAFSVLGGDHSAEANKADMDGNLTAAVTLNKATADATLTFTGTGDQTLTGAITAQADAEGILSTANTGGTVTFNGAIGTDAAKLTSITIAASNTAVFKAATAANTLTINGTATIAENDNESEVFAMGAAGVLYVDKTVTNGEILVNEVVTTRPTIAAGAKIYMPENLSAGQTIKMFEDEDNDGLSDHATTLTEMNAALQDNAIYDYVSTVDATGNGFNIVTATAKTEATTASELSVTANQARALKQALTSAISDTNVDGSAEDAFNNAINGINGLTAADDTALAKQVAPQTDLISGSSVAAQAVTGSVQGIMSNRMASLRSGDAYFGTGVAAGGMSAQSGFIQVFGSEAEQKSTKVGSGTQAGFDSDTQGLAIGFDGVTDNGMTVGVSVATANTDVDGKGSGKSANSIDTYSASLYMDTATENGYFEGSLTYGISENSTSRKVNTAGLNRTYTGSYDSDQLSLNLAAGVPNEVGVGYLTPFGSLTMTSMNIDAYTEKSAVANDALRLKVAQDEVNSMVGTVGLKFHGEMSNGGTPMISLAINNEFGDSTLDTTNTYQNGGTAFKTSTAVEELSATLGLGYSFGSDAASIEFAYEADVNDDDYMSHYGSLKIVGKF